MVRDSVVMKSWIDEKHMLCPGRQQVKLTMVSTKDTELILVSKLKKIIMAKSWSFLHWGRDSLVAETYVEPFRALFDKGFNGAAIV